VQLVDRIYRRCVKPDFPYYDAMDLIQQHLVPRTYVEIGVSTGRTFQLALPGTRCVGIDPAPRLARPVTRGQQIFTLSSDEFFATHDLRAVLGGDPLDLAFIDGMHHFEFALRDFINLERAAHPESTILIHDCLPENEEGAARDRTTVLWSGDVWRLIVLLRRWRPDLEVSVADWPPTGLGVVRHLDPGSTVLADHYHELVEHYLSVPYSALDDGTMDDQLNRVPGTWDVLRDLLPPSPYRSGSVEWLTARRAAHEVVPAARRAIAYRREARRRSAGSAEPLPDRH
jgi:hypothetical protein